MNCAPIMPLPGHLRKNDALFVWGALQPLPYVCAYEQERVEVVHGPSCRVEQEIDTAACAEDTVPIVGRRGGGGTVVLSPGMVIVVMVGTRPAGDIGAVYASVQRRIIDTLRPIVPAGIEQRGISDLVVGDRKVAGSSLYLPRRMNRFCYQCSIMVDSDLSLIERYLRHPPREPDYRGRRPHAEFCTTLRSEGSAATCGEVAARIESGMGNPE